MFYVYLYISGLVVAFIIRLGYLVFTKDKYCNASDISCNLTAVMCSMLSWFAVIIYISIEIRKHVVLKRKEK